MGEELLIFATTSPNWSLLVLYKKGFLSSFSRVHFHCGVHQGWKSAFGTISA